MRYILIGLLVAAIAGGVIAYRMWNKPHREVSEAKAEATLEASDLYAQYAADETAAGQKYLDKILQVCGTVLQVSTGNDLVTIYLDAGNPMGGVSCELDNLSTHPRTEFPAGERGCFKGICTGYLSDVVLNRCSEVKESK